MQITDPPAARKALALAGGLFLGELGLMLFGQVASFAFGRLGIVLQVGWLALTTTLLVAAWMFSKSIESSELPRVLIGLSALVVLLELYWIWQALADQMFRSRAVNVLTSLVSASFVGCWAVLLAQVARPKLQWAWVAAGAVAVLAVIRLAIGLGGMLGQLNLGYSAGMFWVRTGLSAAIALVLGVLALAASGVATGAAA